MNDREAKEMQICLDCKDKVIKFYHFKRKVKEIHKRNIRSNKQKTQQNEKFSKVVHNIVNIVETYTEKCSISTIKIDESSQKLIIQARDKPMIAGVSLIPDVEIIPIASTSSSSYQSSNEFLDAVIKQEPVDDYSDSLWQTFQSEDSNELNLSDVVVKEEPQDMPIVYNSHVATMMIPQPPRLKPMPRRYNQKSTDEEGNINVSKAALKMRAYRERLKKPENRHRYLHHKLQQREWNRRHYIKKQTTTGQPIAKRRRRTQMPDFAEQFDLMAMANRRNIDVNKFLIS